MTLRLHWYAEHRWWWLLLFLLWLSILAISLMTWLFGPSILPLWYTIPVPSQQLAPQDWIGVIPVISTFLCGATLVFSRKTNFEHALFLAQTALISACALQLFLLIALLRISKVAM